ncbi:MAG: hypothetical protein KJ025_02760 [Burkholderiales bacterium]|nr:hypothetical protein [Burkholderiales bacterium]
MRRRINVTIAELALHGLPAADGPRIASALARELERLLTNDARPLGREYHPSARAPEIRFSGNEAGRIGGRLAQVIHDRLTR